MKVAIRNRSSGFTIVELLVVIVVIGILAAITIVSYANISQKAVATSITSDLDSASRQLKLYQIDHGTYPALPLTVSGNKYCPSDDNRYCFKASPGNTFTYTNVAPSTFNLRNENSSISYSTTNNSQPTISNVTNSSNTCPTGFIPVPGSGTYDTNDFCVMKYEASQVGVTTTPISQSGSLPWVNISQTTAITNSANVAGCTGCHLITEAEWLTLTQNVLSVASNWDDGSGGHTVGVGYIYSGHNDNVPANALTADPSDANGYVGTGNVAPSSQKRTLALSNGEVIWDFAGNVYEWTTGTIGSGQQPGLTGEVAYAWKQWNNGSLLQNGFPASAMPAYTGIPGASGWSSAQSIGQMYTNYGDASVRGFLRSGHYNNLGNAGVFALNLNYIPSGTNTFIGFRVSR
ncbi:MAG: prepilin-type N-terminal cleavage/methylation domain-containing protein [Candidatus Saccharibacteria bacterium]|nr:prepilin-type N-terminal cleavage/methylation domain-containing protein [Candidatus Saccharibacteria bacterium]